MVESLINSFIGFFSFIFEIPFGKEIFIFLISCLPILELRGGILAAGLLNMNPFSSFLICFMGNILPVPLILKFITPLFQRLKRTKHFSSIVEKIETRAIGKKEKIEKYQFWGLFFFVGIPLPGTGAWTGSLLASLIDMDRKKAFWACFLGILLAGLIMSFLSFGILGNLF